MMMAIKKAKTKKQLTMRLLPSEKMAAIAVSLEPTLPLVLGSTVIINHFACCGTMESLTQGVRSLNRLMYFASISEPPSSDTIPCVPKM